MRGRKPTPTALKVLTGNPGQRPLNQNEPKPENIIPPMPEWLREFPVAVAEWERESDILYNMGLMTIADLGNLANRSYVASELQRLASEIEKEGRVAYSMRMDSLGNEIADAKSNPKANQQVKLLAEYRQLGSLLGMDAVSRARLSVYPDKNKKSKFDGLIKNGGKK